MQEAVCAELLMLHIVGMDSLTFPHGNRFLHPTWWGDKALGGGGGSVTFQIAEASHRPSLGLCNANVPHLGTGFRMVGAGGDSAL